MAKKEETISLIDTFSEFKELSQTDYKLFFAFMSVLS